MGGQFHLCSLILCVYLFQQIVALPKENIEDSLNVHIREKRAIKNDVSVKIEDSPYLVNVFELDQRFCAASILSPVVVITAARCISDNRVLKDDYAVYSGTSQMDTGTRHKVVRTIKQSKNGDVLNTKCLALLELHPPIDLVKSPNRAISLHPITNIAQDSQAKFTGWGCIQPKEKGHTRDFNSENVLIKYGPTCLKKFSGRDAQAVSNTSICTDYVSRAGLGKCYGDLGAPLVVKDRLIAVMSWPTVIVEHYNAFVFINLAERENYEWVIESQKLIGKSANKNKKQ